MQIQDPQHTFQHIEEKGFDIEKMAEMLWSKYALSKACPICFSEKINEFHNDALNLGSESDEFVEKWHKVFYARAIDAHVKHHCVFSDFANHIIDFRLTLKGKKRVNPEVADEAIFSVDQALYGNFRDIYKELLTDILNLKNKALVKSERGDLDWNKHAVQTLNIMLKQLQEMEKILNSKTHQMIQNHLEWLRLHLMQSVLTDIGNFNQVLVDDLSIFMERDTLKEVFSKRITELRGTLENTWKNVESNEAFLIS